MDFDLVDLISSDATNNAKVNTKFQPKAKPKPKPKPKTQPGPKSAPTGTQEDQTEINVTQISEKSQENVEPYLPLESLNDVLPQSTTLTESPPPGSETTNINVSINGNLEKGPIEPELSNTIESCTNIESFERPDPLTGEEAAIVNDIDFQMGDLRVGSKDAEKSLSWEPLDILSQSNASSGTRVEKFKPKPKAQTRQMEQIVTNDPVSSFMGVADSIPTETVDIHLNQESINLTDVSQMDSMIPSDTPATGPESAKKGKRKTRKGVDPTQEDKASESSGRLRKRANKTYELVDESENEGIDDEFVPENEDSDNSGGNGQENESLGGKKGNKSKKPVIEKEKTVRKRKKAGEVPVESTKVAKKKFPHRTRRNKRQVNPDLLKIPEDELDLFNVPMKELIRLAEHKERIAKKEASTLGTPANNRSGSSFSNNYNEDEGMGSEHDYSVEPESTTYYNYRTHMKIAPRIKWTKQDTELFYEAVQQFGTDLSMIKECFPGRTREQIKSKYKKEERQHPLRLNDALTTRFKGHAHFEIVIERLKQAQSQESDQDDPVNLTGEEDEEVAAADTNDTGDATKAEELGKEVKETESVGPTKSDDSDDDMYRWSQYKSEI